MKGDKIICVAVHRPKTKDPLSNFILIPADV